ncbi:PrgI family protein [Flavobacterium pectinovorum]|uniref:PrgI family protein n=1 Tax=Flavobacterium pectinovorum TaxID=29533 RepID=UPI0026602276|nr:PrgI family protein [Flavobacterium pectinovorum]WKL48630.1 PrgI family protein [Flavobacterium pectinovorum]
MENLNFINPLLHGIIPEELENKALSFSTKQLVCAGVGTLIAGAVLKKAGHQKTGAMIAGLALPILATAIYKKIKKSSDEKAASGYSDADNINEHA